VSIIVQYVSPHYNLQKFKKCGRKENRQRNSSQTAPCQSQTTILFVDDFSCRKWREYYPCVDEGVQDEASHNSTESKIDHS
jgi:hypothetical protein